MNLKLYLGIVGVSLIVAACERAPEAINNPGKTIPSGKTQPSRPTLLDGAYDPAIWEWQRQPDNHYFLAHKSIEKCFVLTDWPMDSHEEEQWPTNTETMLIYGGRYTVTTVSRSADTGVVHYSRHTKPLLHLSVFGSHNCHTEAKMVVTEFEKNHARTN